MEVASAAGSHTASQSSSSRSRALCYGTSCPRCGGLMVGESCMDLLNGELECRASRCIQCGELLDPVILKDRGIGRQSSTSNLGSGTIQIS